MIGIIIVLVMIFETTFLDAQAKYRSTWDATTHRKITMFPYTEEEYEDFFGKQS